MNDFCTYVILKHFITHKLRCYVCLVIYIYFITFELCYSLICHRYVSMCNNISNKQFDMLYLHHLSYCDIL